MENSFNNRDFEQFVKQNADQYRMFPSDKVWKNIHHSIHTRNRWYGYGLAFLLLTIGTVTWVMLNTTTKTNIVSTVPVNTSDFQKINQEEQSSVLLKSPTTRDNNQFLSIPKILQQNLVTEPISLIQNNNVFSSNPEIVSSLVTKEPASIVTQVTPHEVLSSTTAINTNRIGDYRSNKSSVFSLRDPIDYQGNNLFTSKKNNTKESLEEITPFKNNDNAPLTIESIVSPYLNNNKSHKLYWEIFFTPTISYRSLKENKEFINSAQTINNTFNYTSFTNINNLVNHKPDIGMQVGFRTGYSITKNVRVIGGFQINVNKYDIKATYTQPELATIALQTGSGARSSVSTVTNYQNFNGNRPDWLNNLYVSASVPVGLELKLAGYRKTEFGISSTIQPTYILNDRAYLISTDYKNYAEVPSLTRKWNMSSSFEVYAGYSTGKISWRIGPTVRYQLLSSFKEKYPVNEKLFDFGLKIGVMLRK